MKGLICCAGKGSRISGAGLADNKALIKVGGRTLIERNLEAMAPLVDGFCLVVNTAADKIKQAVGSEWKGISVEYVHQDTLDGLVGAMRTAEPAVKGCDVLMALGDEVIDFPRLDNLKAEYCQVKASSGIAVGVVPNCRVDEICRSYTVTVRASGALALALEKPGVPFGNGLKGTGYAMISAKGYDLVMQMVPDREGQYQLADWLNYCIGMGLEVRPAVIGGRTVNINTYEDYLTAEGFFD